MNYFKNIHSILFNKMNHNARETNDALNDNLFGNSNCDEIKGNTNIFCEKLTKLSSEEMNTNIATLKVNKSHKKLEENEYKKSNTKNYR